jgi:peptidoglycan/xylan/chitin deacetylase (PgdA/CDA1 family)
MSFKTLMYHEIREQAAFHPEHPSSIDVKQGYQDVLPAPLFVTLEHFEEQMGYLYEHQYHTLTLDEVKDYYYNGKALPERSILLSFDDCYQSVKHYAYPILKKYGFHAVAFVVTGWLHDTEKEFQPERSICMAAQELSELADVFEFANHTDTFHTRTNPATSRLMTADDDEFATDLELCNSSSVITAKDVFAYPFGLYEARNITLLKSLGFRLAFTSKPGFNELTTDPLLLKRDAVPYFVTLEDFKQLIEQ